MQNNHNDPRNQLTEEEMQAAETKPFPRLRQSQPAAPASETAEAPEIPQMEPVGTWLAVQTQEADEVIAAESPKTVGQAGRSRGGYPMKQEPEPKKKVKLQIVIPAVILAVLVVLMVPLVYASAKMAQLNRAIEVDTSAMPQATGPAPTVPPEFNDSLKQPTNVYANEKAINILLLGLDTRNPKQFSSGLTDSIIIITLDTVNHEIKLSSIMRDSLVEVPGHGLNKINSAFAYAGPQGTMEVIQNYFGVKIDYYAVVNFFAVARIIDSVGGVEIDVKKSEVNILNVQLDEIKKYEKGNKSKHLTKSGLQKLNGSQAVAYMRIRHVGQADFERTERQRTVLQAIADQNFSLPDVIRIANSLPDNVRTNANETQLLSLANTAFGLVGSPIKQFRMPIDGSYTLGRYNKMSVIKVDFVKNAKALVNFIEGK